ncbi:hypothetical protein ES332_D01G157000v1, partial [Gossypium tomentosum]
IPKICCFLLPKESSVLFPFWFSRFHLPCFTIPTRKAPPPSPSQHQTEPPLTFSFLLLFLKVTAKKIGGSATQVHRFRAGTRASRDSEIPASSEKSQDFLDLHPFWALLEERITTQALAGKRLVQQCNII